MRRQFTAIALVVVLVATAGCLGIGTGGEGSGTENAVPEEGAAIENAAANQTAANQTVRAAVNDSTAGEEWDTVAVSYPRDRFTVETVAHENVSLGVDTDADGEIDRRFNETHVSGVNTNDYSYTIALDTGYTLENDDVVVVEYPAVDTPEESGTYTVAVAINDADPVDTDVEIGE
ncbi:hypothetical protein [Halopenitus sp. POP-27]|uniref:hypothetical protein n=1 Tax=Halopenitus sp. POP-27 TaxID=2994425 RepID=UPI002468B6F9|nr:hypothetical protein [Halopenitus sp. POP-27]